MFTRRLIGTVGLFVLTAVAAAQDEKKAPDLPPDVIPATFRAFLVVDDRFPPKVTPVTKPEHRDPKDRTGKMHCLVCENGLSPTIAVFVRAPLAADMGAARQLVVGADSGLAKLIKAVDATLPKFRGERLCGFVMFLQLEGGTKLAKVTAADGTVTNVELDKEYPDDEKRDVYAKDIKDFSNAVKGPEPAVRPGPDHVQVGRRVEDRRGGRGDRRAVRPDAGGEAVDAEGRRDRRPADQGDPDRDRGDGDREVVTDQEPE